VKNQRKLWLILSLAKEREERERSEDSLDCENPKRTLGKTPEKNKIAHDNMHFSRFQDYPRTVC
jgi:hypothetical protein